MCVLPHNYISSFDSLRTSKIYKKQPEKCKCWPLQQLQFWWLVLFAMCDWFICYVWFIYLLGVILFIGVWFCLIGVWFYLIGVWLNLIGVWLNLIGVWKCLLTCWSYLTFLGNRAILGIHSNQSPCMLTIRP